MFLCMLDYLKILNDPIFIYINPHLSFQRCYFIYVLIFKIFFNIINMLLFLSEYYLNLQSRYFYFYHKIGKIL